MALFDSITKLIGKTPLIELQGPSKDAGARILGKAEFLNPGGSVKDRIGLAMIEAAERDRLLKPGDTIVEATAGNTGVALAMVAAARGYRCVFVMPEKMSKDKEQLLRAYGAEILRTANAPRSDPRNFRNRAQSLAKENGWFLPEQFSNKANPDIHYSTTGAEIWNDLGSELDALVAGVGTGGTLSGTGAFLKSKNPKITVICADPEGSVLAGGPDGSYELEGIGTSAPPTNYNANVVDAFETISDLEAFQWCRRLAREEGVLVGGAAGCAVAAAIQYAQRSPDKNQTIVAILPDTGRNYLSKIFNDDWFESFQSK